MAKTFGVMQVREEVGGTITTLSHCRPIRAFDMQADQSLPCI